MDLQEEQAHLDFLGYTFRYDRDLEGRGHRYLNIVPSKKAVQRERDRLREMTDCRRVMSPAAPDCGAELNLKGWGNYFSFGRPRAATEDQNLRTELPLSPRGRRSQRPYRRRRADYTQLFLRMGRSCWVALGRDHLRLPAVVNFRESRMRENLHVRFDEGRVGRLTREVTLSPTLPVRKVR